jgi:transcriptional regulator with GAF, ATPase, and Fis domain
LYYRLRAYHVRVPPLTARHEDLLLLLHHFAELAAHDLGRPTPTLPPNLVDRLRDYHFPGNVRELQSMVFHAVAEQESQELSVASFVNLMETEGRSRPPEPAPPAQEASAGPHGLLTPADFQKIERENIERALEAARWKISGAGGAAERLGLKPSTLTSKMKKLGINKS